MLIFLKQNLLLSFTQYQEIPQAMCDNCAPNTHKLKERLKYWYGALTTNPGEQLHARKVIEEGLAVELFDHIFSESAWKKIIISE